MAAAARTASVAGRARRDAWVRRRSLGRRRQAGPAVRVGAGDEEEVAVGLGHVAQGKGAGVAQAQRHAAGEERCEPAKESDDVGERDIDAGDDQGRERQQQAEEDGPAVLALAVGDAQLYRVAPHRSREAGKGVADQVDVGADVELVAQVGGEEAVQRFGGGAGDEGRDPVDDRGKQGHQSP
jgi:hypothetical protein